MVKRPLTYHQASAKKTPLTYHQTRAAQTTTYLPDVLSHSPHLLLRRAGPRRTTSLLAPGSIPPSCHLLTTLLRLASGLTYCSSPGPALAKTLTFFFMCWLPSHCTNIILSTLLVLVPTEPSTRWTAVKDSQLAEEEETSSLWPPRLCQLSLSRHTRPPRSEPSRRPEPSRSRPPLQPPLQQQQQQRGKREKRSSPRNLARRPRVRCCSPDLCWLHWPFPPAEPLLALTRRGLVDTLLYRPLLHLNKGTQCLCFLLPWLSRATHTHTAS